MYSAYTRPQDWSQEKNAVGRKTDKMVNHTLSKKKRGDIFCMWYNYDGEHLQGNEGEHGG